MLAPGVRIDRYEIVGPIGEGGMASVWAARQLGMHGFEKLVALKVIHSRYAEDPAFRTMFLDEARVIAPLAHRNVAQVLDLGDTGELLYIALEYVEGDSLYALTPTKRRVPVPIALRIAADAASGLAAVHELTDLTGAPRNVIHRDVSPQNLLLTKAGEVKLIDFGIAHARDRLSRTTDASTVKGKLRYMAPEQARGGAITQTADIFALGAVLFRMLSGHAPYAAATDLPTIQALLAGAPPLHELPDDVPPDVAAILRQALAPAPDDRFRSARAMREALESVLAAEGAPVDVAAWVRASLGPAARDRHAKLAARLASLPAIRIEAPPRPSRPAIPVGRGATVPLPAIAPLRTPAAVAPPAAAPAPPLAAPAPLPGAPAPAPAAPSPPAAPLPALPLPSAPPPPDAPAPRTVDLAALPAARAAEPRAVDAPDAPAPAFMDVRALVAQARAGIVHAPPPRAPDPPTAPGPTPPAPAPGAAGRPPAPGRTVALEATRDPSLAAGLTSQPTPGLELAVVPLRAAPPPRWGNAPKLAALVVIAVLALLAVVLITPLVVKNRAIATAATAGFELTVESAGLGPSGVSLRGATLRSRRVPGLTARIERIEAVGLSARELRLLEPVVELTGDPVDLEVGLGALLQEDRARFAGTAEAPRRLVVVGGKVSFVGPGAGLDAAPSASAEGIALEVESRGAGTEEIKGSVARVVLKKAGTSFGPWGLTVERSPVATRVRVAFDPPVADGPSALFVQGGTVPTELTVRIPRYAFAHLGIDPAALGIPATPATEIELNLAATYPSAAPATAKLDATLLRIAPKGFAGPVDVHVDATASGPPERPLNVDRALVTAGPFTANATGTVTPYEQGVRADLVFKVVPVPCDRVARSAGGVAAFVQAVGQATGALRITGAVNVSGLVKYDSATPTDAQVSWFARESCGVSIFGL